MVLQQRSGARIVTIGFLMSPRVSLVKSGWVLISNMVYSYHVTPVLRWLFSRTYYTFTALKLV